MIIITHHNGVLTDVAIEGSSIDTFNGRPIVASLFELAALHPEKLLVWCHTSVASDIAFHEIPSLFTHRRMLLSYGVANSSFIPDSIGYVEDSPFVSIAFDVSYPTWLMSSDVGAIYAETLLLFGRWKRDKDFDYFLNSIAKMGQKDGILCYSEPQLLNSEEKKETAVAKMATGYQMFQFVYQHYRTQWMFLLLLNLFIYEKRFPLLPFIVAFFRGKRNSFTPKVATLEIPEKEFGITREIDVIIPTIGRKKYLLEVLNDLAAQTFTPARVIIVEQNPEINSNSDLDYLGEHWPFEIRHHFIHKLGACNARNLALKEVISPWVFMADDDIRIPTNFFENVFAFLNNFSAKAVTVGCLMEGEIEATPRTRQWNAFGSGCSVVASNIATTTAFDMALENGYGEDKEYGMRLRKKGVDILYNPDIKIKHLKAPVGGFRSTYPKPWETAQIPPKPAPTIMYFKLKHATGKQIKGYKTRLFIKFYRHQKVKNPFSYLKIYKKRWNSSLLWANKLKGSP